MPKLKPAEADAAWQVNTPTDILQKLFRISGSLLDKNI
jgi:hypothetical protein